MAIKVASFRDWNITGIIDGIGQSDIKAILYFFSPAFEEYEPQKILAEAFPAAACFGASMIGGWSSDGAGGGGALESGITAMSLSADEVEQVYVSFQEGVKKDPVRSAKAAIAELKQKTAGENINPDEYLGLIFFDGLCLGELIVKEFSLEQDFNMAFVGGAAADELAFTKTLVGAGARLSGDGLAAVILKMKIPFFFNHYVHYLPTDTSFSITRVETMKRIAWEIDGEPAAVFYARQIGIDDVSRLDAGVFAKHPVGLKFGDSIYVRSPNAVINGVGLQFYCYIEAGTRVFLLKQGDIIDHTEKGLADAAHFLPGIQGCLLFNCVLRYLEIKELNKLDEFNNVFSKCPMIGFNTYGEELFTHHNQTLTAVFFGTLPEADTMDPYKAKRLFHYTDSKLKSLVFDIVSRSELLNITISYLKGSMDAESGDSALINYEAIRKSLGTMIEQSNVSKEDIERLLVVYQKNVEETGEYVFSIVDEIRKQNRRLIELREDAETANRTKTNFLASMSHEIRTPMNAITGMAELLLRSELSDEARGYAQDIKQAGSNLISIINDILDISKIEAGKLEIIPVEYLLASLINDTVNIISMRLAEKPIRFYTNIDRDIPNGLIGDEVRLRQILINLLSNAVKYSNRGCISLAITVIKKEDKQVWLKIVVSDTGKGIKPEDQSKLFGDFVQVDTKKNRGIEGTGLGLAITKRLCLAMGGDITVESEYGKGSMFTVVIPQEIHSRDPFAAVEDPDKKKVLIYERRTVYAKSVCWSLENMSVPYEMVTSLDDFSKALFREEWFFVFSGYGLYEKIKPVMEKPGISFPGKKKPPLALMVEWGTEAYIPNVRFVSLPVQSLSIANVLNGKADSKGYPEGRGSAGMIRFTLSRARLLIVDDIATNLKVAEGLLAPYQAAIDTCLNGMHAIELVKQHNYDIVFMDHMMPEMDGIEATTAIRALEGERFKTIPIIALTANAVSGMREMFIEKGFDDFLAKPIDVSKLDETLDRWIPKEKQDKKIAHEKKLIMLVDDNPVNLKSGKDILSEKYTIATVPSAEKMFIRLENVHPALILLDIDMPVTDGYEAIKTLKSKPGTKDIPVVLLAETAGLEDEEKGRSLEAAGCIAKPFDSAVLIACIEKYL
ncbi:MAG: response regulator [Treponema sp.]|nr:response regulator [Treponema sp.]